MCRLVLLQEIAVIPSFNLNFRPPRLGRARGEAVDYLTFVPDGEPTLDSQLGDAIDSLHDLGLPIAAITNATLIGREDVRAVLNRADWANLKVESVDADIWQQIKRPHPELRLADIIDGIRTFARTYSVLQGHFCKFRWI